MAGIWGGQMNRDRRKEIFEAIGVIAIVASLIFLALETRQNTNALYADSRRAVMDAAFQELMVQLERPGIALTIIDEGIPSPEEQISLDSFLAATLIAREYAWLQFQSGTIDQMQWDTQLAVIATIFDAERNRNWWRSLGRNYFGADYAAFIDEQIESRPATNEIWQTTPIWAGFQP